MFAEKGSPYGFPAVSGSQPARPNRKALLSKTNGQVNTTGNSNEVIRFIF
jgi:hypothetical protein